MKFLFILPVVFLSFLFSSSTVNKEASTIVNTKKLTPKSYPENISKIFKAHGTLEVWNQMQSLEFTTKKRGGNEVTLTQLKNRKSLIQMPKFAIGYTGKEVWIQNKSNATYKGNAKFYYNLWFYFVGMPFVLADEGIFYEDAEPLIFDGVTYPGIKISYGKGIGESPDDEYILYYDAETYQMQWLAYTVTFHTKEKSKEFHFMQYNNWETVNGLVLPKKITIYNYKDKLPTTPRKSITFTEVKVSPRAPEESLFEIPTGANIVE